MGWNYAQLSHLAKRVGGPNALVNQIYRNGRNMGRSDIALLIPLAVAGGAAIYKGFESISNRIKANRSKNEKKAKEAMNELERGIKDYDREN